jgi:hypothetical protein
MMNVVKNLDKKPSALPSFSIYSSGVVPFENVVAC